MNKPSSKSVQEPPPISTAKNEQVLIRKIKNVDSETVCKMHIDSIKHFCSGFYPETAIASWIASKTPGAYQNLPKEVITLVAEIDNEIIGFGMMNLAEQSITSLYLRPGFSGKGYGKTILESLEAIAKENYISTLIVCSTINAIDFYHRMGYQNDRMKVFTLQSGTKLKCIEVKKSF